MRRRVQLAALAIALCAASRTAYAEDGNWPPIGQLVGGSPYSVAVQGGHAYVAAGTAGLRVIDISDPAVPVEVASCDTAPDWTFGVAVAGSWAYVTDCAGGMLRIIDVSSPVAPVEVGSWHTPGLSYGVAVSDGYAYVADLSAGLRVIDVSNAAAPVEVGSYDTSYEAYGVAVSDGYAFVADQYDGLRVIDVSDQTAPVEVGSWDTPNFAFGVAVEGEYAYVADNEDGLRVIDVSNPAAPMEVGSCDTPGWAESVAVAGGYAYVADYDAGLRVIDVSSPAAPTEVGFWDTPGRACGVAVGGGYVVLADFDWGLLVFPEYSTEPRPVLATTKFPTSQTAQVGDQVSFMLGYENDGTATAEAVILIDVLDPLLLFVSAGDGGVYDDPTHTVTWSLGDLPEGASGTVALTVQVSDSAPLGASIENQTSLSATNAQTATSSVAVVIVENTLPDTPANTTPPSGAPDIPLTPTLEASAFSDPDAGDTLVASHWQVRSASGSYSTPVWDKPNGTAASVVVPAGVLSHSQTYWWHVRYQDNHGAWSEWSSETSFATAAAPANNPPSTPANVSPPSGAPDVSLTPTLGASAFSDPDAGDTLAASHWQIRSASGSYSAPVWNKPDGTGTSVAVPSGVLSYSQTHWWHVRYQDNHGAWSEWSPETSFTTTAAPPPPPPPPPSLVWPADGQVIATATPTLDWTDVSGADSYDIQADDDPDFSSCVIARIMHPSSEYAVSAGTLQLGATYYWRVRSRNSGGTSGWAGPRSFVVGLGFTQLMVSLEHKTDADGVRRWREAVRAVALDVRGGGNLSRVQVRTPGGEMGEVTPATAPAGDWQVEGQHATVWWRGGWGGTIPQFGGYQVTVQSTDGLSCAVTTRATTHVPQYAPTISSPSNGATVTNRRPQFSWVRPSEAATGYQLQVSGPSPEWAPGSGYVWDRGLASGQLSVQFNDNGTAGVAELTPGTQYGLSLARLQDVQVSAGGAGTPEEWRREAAWREVRFTVSAAAGTRVSKLHVVQAPAPGTDLVAGKLTAVRVFVSGIAPDAEGTAYVRLDVRNEDNQSILPAPLGQWFTFRQHYGTTEQEAALFLFPGSGPGSGPSISLPGRYRFIASVAPDEVGEPSDEETQDHRFRTTGDIRVLLRRVAVGARPAPTEDDCVGMLDFVERAYPVASGVTRLQSAEWAVGSLNAWLDVILTVGALEAQRVWYNLTNAPGAPDADFIVGVVPNGSLWCLGAETKGVCFKGSGMLAALVEAAPGQEHVLAATVAHELGHLTGVSTGRRGLGEEYINYSVDDGLRVFACGSFECDINPPPIHVDPYAQGNWWYVCRDDLSTRRALNFWAYEPTGDGAGCFVEEGAFDPAWEVARDTRPMPWGSYGVTSFMGTAIPEPDCNWITRVVWNYLLSCLDASATASRIGPSAATAGPVLVVSGLLYRDGTAQLQPAYEWSSGTPTPSQPGGQCSVELVDAVGSVLERCDLGIVFEMEHLAPQDVPAMPFSVTLAWHPETATVVLQESGSPIAELVVTASVPALQLLSPSGGEALTGMHTVNWSADDADGDALYYTLLYSRDCGVSWVPLAANLTETEYEWDTRSVPGGTECLIRVLATDGVNTASDDSDGVFSVAAKGPAAAILEPRDGTQIAAGRAAVLSGAALDPEDGGLPSDALVWSSDVDGFLGSGSTVRVEHLTPGAHTLTLTVTDSDGNSAGASVSLTVLHDTDQDGMPDDWEALYAVLDPTVRDAALDPDQDYLRNEEEYLLGTRPDTFDTDGGGEPDGLERMAGRDALSPGDDVSQTFADVPPDFWGWQQIEAANRLHIVQGYGEGLYRPEGTITRDQMAVYMARALAGGDGGIPVGPETPTFWDVPAQHWAYRHIEYAAEQNVVQGYAGGDYRPDATVSRDQMAVYVARFMVAPGGDQVVAQFVPTGSASFPDVTEDSWAYRHVGYCAAAGVVRGYGDGLYHPERQVTRDQMAVYVVRAMGLGQ
jgi:uncharacterized repeat protein (TIGR01451 family)